MSFKIHPILVAALLCAIGILLFALIRGCNKGKNVQNDYINLAVINDSLRMTLELDSINALESKARFQDSLDFERGQNALLEEQKDRTQVELNSQLQVNKALIKKHQLYEYTDTSTSPYKSIVVVPTEFVEDCKGCFTNLTKTTNLADKYEVDLKNLKKSNDNIEKKYQKRLTEVEAERNIFRNKVGSLAKQQDSVLEKLKPHGKLYLSWGVIWGPWPKMAGAGIMYQNKRNLLWGAKWYYGSNGQMVETTINFPLSLRFK